MATAAEFERLVSAAARTDWVVYAKPPFGGPEQVLKYLARYTHRVAISNSRLLDFEDGFVRFRYKDYAHGNRKRVMRLSACGVRAAVLAARAADGVRADSPLRDPVESPSARGPGVVPSVAWRRPGAPNRSRWRRRSSPEPAESVTPTRVCPVCGAGRMIVIAEFPPLASGAKTAVGVQEYAAVDSS